MLPCSGFASLFPRDQHDIRGHLVQNPKIFTWCRNVAETELSFLREGIIQVKNTTVKKSWDH